MCEGEITLLFIDNYCCTVKPFPAEWEILAGPTKLYLQRINPLSPPHPRSGYLPLLKCTLKVGTSSILRALIHFHWGRRHLLFSSAQEH